MLKFTSTIVILSALVCVVNTLNSQVISNRDMKLIIGGAKHCKDTRCSTTLCENGTFFQGNGVTGKTCNGSPATVCCPKTDSEVDCGEQFSNCNEKCTTCTSMSEKKIAKTCYSRS